MFIAAQMGHPAICRELIEKGADIDARDNQRKYVGHKPYKKSQIKTFMGMILFEILVIKEIDAKKIEESNVIFQDSTDVRG